MRISHEAIYQALYVQGRGALRRELIACLRTGRALRVPRARTRGRGKKLRDPRGHDQRAARRGRGPGRARALGGRPHHRAEQLGDRHPGRADDPVHDAAAPAADGRPRHRAPGSRTAPRWPGTAPRRSATRSPPTITTLPEQLRRSLTWDQGAEMAQHAQLRIDTGIADLLLRPAQPLAARHEREHQRPAAPVLPQGHRPEPPQPRRPRRRRRRAQQPASQDTRLEDTQPRHSTSSYTPVNKAVLRRPLEPKEYTAGTVPPGLRAVRHHPVHGPARVGAGQRGHRVLALHPGIRAALAAALRDQGRGPGPGQWPGSRTTTTSAGTPPWACCSRSAMNRHLRPGRQPEMPALLRRQVSAGTQPCQGRSSLDRACAPAEYGSSREARTGKISQVKVSTL